MSFFSKILKGLGFEDDEEKPTKPEKQVKVKDKKQKLKPNFASYDLNETEIPTEPEKDKQEQDQTLDTIRNESVVKDETTINGTLDVIKVTTQVEVQKVIDKIKKDESVIVNMLGLSQSDLTRSLDFLTGAVYGLDKSMQKVDDAIYIIQ